MRKILLALFISFAFGMIANAQIQKDSFGSYTITKCKSIIDYDSNVQPDTITNSNASIGNSGITLTFGGFVAYAFIWQGEPRILEETTIQKAADLVSGKEYVLYFRKGQEPNEYVLLFDTRPKRQLIFTLIKNE